MENITVQYLSDAQQEIQAVLISIEDWRKIQAQLLAYQQHRILYEDLKTAFEEVKLFKKGKKKARKLKDVLKEI
ncbi:MAG: hypothetical protein EAZ97_00225 [Bacteroidetes bacterium]|nr:MAG: hypothetical protein EAZ97_00225 [Bacteroidota bacterium]